MGRPKKKGRVRSTEAVIAKARRALQANDATTAIEILATAAIRQRDQPRLLEALAEAYERDGRTIDALKQLDRMIDIGAGTATIWKRTGQLLANVREYAQALGAFERSIQLDGLSADVRHDYGRVLYKLGDLAGSAKQLEQAAELCDEVDPWLALATLAPSNPGYDHADVLRIRQRFSAALARHSKKQPDFRPAASSRDRLRIGYLSSWFDRENYMKPVWGG